MDLTYLDSKHQFDQSIKIQLLTEAINKTVNQSNMFSKQMCLVFKCGFEKCLLKLINIQKVHHGKTVDCEKPCMLLHRYVMKYRSGIIKDF